MCFPADNFEVSSLLCPKNCCYLDMQVKYEMRCPAKLPFRGWSCELVRHASACRLAWELSMCDVMGSIIAECCESRRQAEACQTLMSQVNCCPNFERLRT